MTTTRAERAAALLPTSGPEQPHTTARGDAFIAFAYATLQREFGSLVATRPRNPAAPTAHEVHQLRVAARRLRVALRLFRHMLPGAGVTRLRAELRWFARALGEVRDLDVYTDNYRAYVLEMPKDLQRELGAYELYLRRERAEARGRLPAVFAAPRYTALLDAAAALCAGPSPGAQRRWRTFTTSAGVTRSLRNSLGRVRRLGNRIAEHPTARDLHELRIRAKRLRYELEFFAPVYPALAGHARTVKALQDLLGEHQDVYEATARLRRYARQTSSSAVLPPALAELRLRQLRRARAIRRSFVAAWQPFLATVSDAPRVAQ
jgi:CHAD domain-containing protein